MTKRLLSKQETKRGHQAALGGALLAAIITILVVYAGFYGITDQFNWTMVLVYAPAAAFATWLCIWFYWKLLMRDGETRKRGAYYGGLAVGLSLFLMSFFVIVGGGVYGLMIDGWDVELNPFEALLMVPVMTFVLTLYAMIFGGFLAIPLGAFSGYMLTKNPE